MEEPRDIVLPFPFGGIDVATGVQGSPPHTTADCVNVWPYDINNRLVGSVRPGTTAAFAGATFTPHLITTARITVGGGSTYSWIAIFGTAFKVSIDAGANFLTASNAGSGSYLGALSAASDSEYLFFADGTNTIRRASYNPAGPPPYVTYTTIADAPVASVVTVWRDRLVCAGIVGGEHLVRASRQGTSSGGFSSSNKEDWDDSATDAGAPWTLNTGAAGQIGDDVLALIPHSDDTMLIGCRKSLYRLDGDPTAGGTLTLLSSEAGVHSKRGWCQDASGNVYFINRHGLWRCAGGGRPENLSGQRLGSFFTDKDSVFYGLGQFQLVYDLNMDGVWIFALGDISTARTHLFYDIKLDSFWPMRFPAAQGPACATWIQASTAGLSGIYLGGPDGKIRQLGRYGGGTVDEGTNAITSSLLIGAYVPNSDSARARLTTARFVLGDGRPIYDLQTNGSAASNARLAYTLIAADDAQSLFTGSGSVYSTQTGTITDWGAQAPVRHRIGGNTFGLQIGNTTVNKTWSFERAILTFLPAGRVR